MNDYLDQPLESGIKGKRPVMLLVLSILTYAGAVVMILYAGVQLHFASRMKEMFSNPLMPLDERIKDVYNWLIVNSLLTIANCILTVFGAILMFSLRKWGFYVYAASQLLLVVGLAGTMYFTSRVSAIGISEIAFSGFPLLISVIFTVLYALNLKYMNRNKSLANG